jgi:hypothetical protein
VYCTRRAVVDDDENIKQLLNLSTIFVVDVKVDECLGIVVCVSHLASWAIVLPMLWLDIRPLWNTICY